MKRIIISLLSIFLPMVIHAQSTQPCVVRQYNQKEEKTPLAGVEVMVSNAGSAVSDSEGKFTLIFRTLKPGDKVNLISAKKAGYELFNTSAVQQWNVSRNQQPFTLVLVKKEFFDQLKANLTQTSADSYKRKYEQAVKELEQQKKSGQLKEEEFNRKYDELETQFQTQLSNLSNYIDSFARIDLGDMSAEEQHILEMVQDGKIDEAVQEWDRLEILDKLLQEKKDYRKLQEAETLIRETKEEKEENIKYLQAALQNQIATLKLAGGKENYDKIGRLLRERALADTTDFDAVIEYALFAQEQNDFREAERFFLMFSGDSDDTRQFWASSLLGTLYLQTGRYDLGEKLMLRTVQEFEAQEEEHVDNMGFWENYSTLLTGLGTMYGEQGSSALAEEYLRKALDITARMYRQDPDIYCYNLAFSQESIGSLYFTLNDFTHAGEYYLQAQENYLRRFGQNPDDCRADLTRLYNNMGMMYYNLGDIVLAEEYHLKSLEQCTILVQQNPDAYCRFLVRLQNNLGLLYDMLHDAVHAEEYYREALDNCKPLFNRYPYFYRSDLLTVYGNLGRLYIDEFQNDARALEIWGKMLEVDPDLLSYHEDGIGLYQALKERGLIE